MMDLVPLRGHFKRGLALGSLYSRDMNFCVVYGSQQYHYPTRFHEFATTFRPLPCFLHHCLLGQYQR